MIKYALQCELNHEFESWFRDSAAFDTQAKRGFVTCPVCQCAKVTKAIMAPAVMQRRGQAIASDLPMAEPLLNEQEGKMRTLARQIREHVVSTTEDVGSRFPEEARAMHDGTIEARSIMGVATLAEVKELLADGVSVMPVPVLPDERH